jgi:hypothetical protein
MYDDRHKKNTYASSTMVTDGELVYAFFESAGLYAYDLDGKLVWSKSLGGIAKAGMGPGTSPILFEDLIILQCDQEMGKGSFIIALDKRDGREVWRQERSTRRSWATPLIIQTPNASSPTIRAPAVNCGGPMASRAIRFRARSPGTVWFSSPRAARRNARWPSALAAMAI